MSTHACQKCGADFEREAAAHWKRLCLACWIQAKNATGDAPPPPRAQPADSAVPIPTDMLGRLIRLCHPDKHQDSAMATEATKWLLAQRRASP